MEIFSSDSPSVWVQKDFKIITFLNTNSHVPVYIYNNVYVRNIIKVEKKYCHKYLSFDELHRS